MKTAKICAFVAFILNFLSLIELWPLFKFVLSINAQPQKVILPLTLPMLQGLVTLASFGLWLYFRKKDKENQIVKNSKIIGYVLIILAPVLFFASYVVALAFIYNLNPVSVTNNGAVNQSEVRRANFNGITPITPDEVKNMTK